MERDMGPTVRSGSKNDVDAVFGIDNVTWSPTSSPGPHPTNPHELGEGHELLVAEIDDEVVGYLKLTPPTPLASNAHVRHIIGLAVHPDHQRRGVARALLSAVTERARSAGWTKLSLRVLAPNVQAQDLYRACGFKTEGVLLGEFRIDGEAIDDVLMAWHARSVVGDT